MTRRRRRISHLFLEGSAQASRLRIEILASVTRQVQPVKTPSAGPGVAGGPCLPTKVSEGGISIWEPDLNVCQQ